MKGWKKVFHENENQKKSVVAVLISDKFEFKIKTVLRDKDDDQEINPRRIYNNFYIQNTRVSPQHLSFQWVFSIDFPLDWLVWSSWCPEDSQEPSPITQLEGINSWAYIQGKTWFESIHAPQCLLHHCLQ